MNRDEFERERLYQATIAIARAMLRRSLITEEELSIIDAKMREKYKPLLGTLHPAINPNLLDI